MFNLSGRASAAMKQAAVSAGLGVAVLTVALAGLGFLTAAFYLFLSQRFGTPAAAAMTGGMLLVLAMLLGAVGGAIIKKLKKPQPSLLAEFGGTFGLGVRLVGMLVRRDPKKAVILAAVTGAIAEYVMGDKKE